MGVSGKSSELGALGEGATDSGRGQKWSLAAREEGTPRALVRGAHGAELSRPATWRENWEMPRSLALFLSPWPWAGCLPGSTSGKTRNFLPL